MGLFSRFEGKMEDTFEGAADKMSNSPISPVQIVKKAEKQMKREKVVSAGRQYAPTLYTVLVNPDDDQRLFGFYPTLAGEAETRLAAAAASEGLVMEGQPLVRFIVDESLKHGKFDIIAEPVSAPIIAQLRAEEMQRYGMGGAMGGGAPYPNAGQPAGYPAAAAQGFGRPAPAPAPAQPQVQPYGAPMGAAAPQPYGEHDPFAEPPMYGLQQGGSAPFGQQPQMAPQAQPQAEWAAQQNPAKPPLPYVPEEEIDYSVDYGEYTFDSRNFQDYRQPAEPERAQAEESRDGGQTGFSEASDEAPAASHPESADPFDGDNNPDPFSDVDSQQSDQAASQPFAPSASQPFDQQADAPYGQQPYGAASQPFAQPGYGQNAYGQSPYGQNAYGQQPGQQPGQPYGAASQPFAQPGYGQPGFDASYGQPYGAPVSAPFGQQPYAAAPVPPTSVFANGAGGVNAVPAQNAVRARLVDMATGRSYNIATNRVLLGRDRSCTIMVNDINASRQHAELRYEPQGVWVITDLGSTNGTLVNGQSVSRMGLREGDRVTLGITDFIFTLR